MNGRLVVWWLLRVGFLACLAAVAWLSLAPHVPVPQGFEFNDKLGHVLAYAALGFTGTALLTVVAKLALSIATAAFGVAMEAAQSEVASRTFELADIGANLVGITLGVLCALVFERLMNRRWPPRPVARRAYAALRTW